MTVLALTPDRNVRLSDYSGAFKLEAMKFCTLYGGRRVEVPLDRPQRFQKETVLGAIESFPVGELECVAFFCHGFQKKLQFAFTNGNAGELAGALAARGCSRVALYACSTGSGPGPGGDGGFADVLRDKMCMAGLKDCRVLGHRVSGHTTTNRKKRFFDGMGSETGGAGGYDVVTESSVLWSSWSKRIRDTKDPFRFRIMWMSVAEIHAELAGA